MYGHDAYVDATPARAHITALMAAGMGLKQIVAVSDISQGLLWKLIYGKRRTDGTRTPSKRIRLVTEQTILTITLNLADGARIDSTGTTRRIQALVAIGWSQSKIAARLGILRSNFTALAHGQTDVTVAHANAVADLYDELWNTAPPRAGHRDKIAYSRSIRYATLAHWCVPMAWDTETIDDPAAKPDLGLHDNLTGGKRVHVDDIEFLADQGLTIEQVAHRMSVVKSTIEHACARSDRRDLLARMIRNKTVQEYAA
jgi:transcriptional regulator with XRE-family HTH domain